MDKPTQRPNQSQQSIAFDRGEYENIVVGLLPLVHYIARQIHNRLPPQVLIEDLVHAGVLGLVQAAKKYDPGKNVQLKHYAGFRIRGAILDSLRQADWSPRSLRRKGRKLRDAISACQVRLGHEPGEPEIAEELGVNLETLQRLRGLLQGLEIRSLEDPDPLRAEGLLENARRTGAEREYENPYRQTLRLEMTTLLTRAMGDLSQRDREVISLYHYEELTLKQVAAVMGVGESRASQIHTAAMPRLRARMHELLHPKRPDATLSPVPVVVAKPLTPEETETSGQLRVVQKSRTGNGAALVPEAGVSVASLLTLRPSEFLVCRRSIGALKS